MAVVLLTSLEYSRRHKPSNWAMILLDAGKCPVSSREQVSQDVDGEDISFVILLL